MRHKGFEGAVLAAIAVVGLGVTLALAGPLRASDRLVQQFHQTYPLSSRGRFSLENVNGDVQITGWDRDQVKVDAVKTVWSGTSLEDLKIEVESRPDAIRIETTYPRHWFGDPHWRVDYTITLPKYASINKVGLINGGLNVKNVSGDISASSVNGHIETQGSSGEVNLSAVNGTIRATLGNPNLTRPVSINTVNGSISVSLPADSNAHISARTLNGTLSCDFPLTVNAAYVGHKLDGTIGKGGGDVQLKTVNGSISIFRGASEAN
jgi:Putative adhesin